MRGVSDVPRMYRRTNRATPSAPCSYVTQAVAALARAHSEQLDTWLEEAVQTVAAAYLLQVTLLKCYRKIFKQLEKIFISRSKTCWLTCPRWRRVCGS